MSDQDKNLSVLPTIEELALMIDDEELRQETLLLEIIDGQSKKAMEIEQSAKSDELLNKVPTLGEVSTTRDASLGASTVVMSASLPINFPRPNSPDRFKEKKEKESAETSLELWNHRPPPCYKPFSSLALTIPKPQRKPSQEVELNNQRNIVDVLGMEKTRPRFEADQKETTYANETLVDSRSASLTINLPRPDSPEYDEISDTEIDQYVSKPLEEDAVHEMDFKFRVLKRTLEQIDDRNEKQRHFEAIYQEYAVWCEIRIDPIVMMYFVHKFHTECALYMLQHYGIHVDVRRYENELIRRTEDPNWTDAQKLKRKVLQRRKSNSTKKKICAKRVGDVFNELLAGEFPNVVERDSFSIAKISALIECSKSKRDVFSRTLCKYDKYGELPGLLEKVLVNNWISFFYCLPLNGFGESDTLNEYERVHRDLPLNVPPSTHITFLSDIKEWFIHMKNRREREERGRRGNEERQREAEILRKREDENNSRKRFSLLEPGSIFYRLLQATASLFGMTPAVSRASTSD